MNILIKNHINGDFSLFKNSKDKPISELEFKKLIKKRNFLAEIHIFSKQDQSLYYK